ncbi:DUF5711 family protein [Butyrivibrio sp. YAB3001]|uniref:DUF5711 family protein n=1 Tax=Butyrivibrio sp. YAB3001 TaxID=1520812 RepID=UPI0008F64B92|nr:DUF5711 family protein [Butyrivibrio sp. YAB3001]SFB95951.1 hypothetical protein SAMN02910398_01143 [Butyrivibrio sp. YAB3001]
MAEVKDFSSYAKKQNISSGISPSSTGHTSYKEKIRTHRLRVFFSTVFIIVFVALLVTAIYTSWRNKEFSEATVSIEAKIPNGMDAKVINLSGYIVQYSKDGVSCFSSNGQPVWNQTYEMQNPIAHFCNSVVAIGDYNGHIIYVSNTSGSMGMIDTNLPIRDFCVAGQGVVAAVLDGTDVTWIYIYDSKGNVIANFKTTMKDSGYPISISLSPNAELLCVSYLYPDEGALKTSVAFFNFGSVGQNAIDNYASGYDYPGVVVPYVKFINSNTAFAVSDDRIMFYKGDQKPVSQAENLIGNEEIRSIFNSDEYVGLVFSNSTSDGQYRLQVYNSDGQMILTTYFDLAYSDIVFYDNQIIIYNEDECIIRSVSGHDKYMGSFSEPVKVMIPTNMRSKFTLVTSNNIETMNLK